jgi:MYXO-CTERM domain-containing protein
MLDSDGDGSADCVDDSPLPLPAEPEGETKGGGCASTPDSGSALLGLLALLGLRRRAGVR